MPNGPIHLCGSRTTSDIATIVQPSAHNTPPNPDGTTNVQPKPTMENSSTTSHSPRVHRKRPTCRVGLPRAPYRNAPVPARKKNTGAQKCVIQRVKKRAPQVCVTSSGSNLREVKKSRV